MLRSFFLALGISMVILGSECLVVEQVTIKLPPQQQGAAAGLTSNKRDVKPPEWAPWGLLSGGVVVSLYSLTIARQ